ncbi:MAG: CRISPR-associated endoribonuclease Cas6 [Candidatus Aenigmatarchaeota archaeon]
MRIILQFSPIEKVHPISFFNNKFMLQGFFYSLFLKSEKLKNKHEQKGFKFFCFSDVFKINNSFFIIFSSPDKELVEETKEVLKKIEYFYMGYSLFKKEKIKVIDIKIGKKIKWQTGSPIVVYYKNRPFSFIKDKNYSIFVERLKENSLKKYEAFFKESIEIGDIFDLMKIKKSVSIPLEKHGKKFLIFGSLFDLLEKSYIENKERKFYKFLLDCGLGEKNSLGFGFVNPIKKD